jgi:4-amino-4-deoxy-L-arabinose transferase-like glycosyltransferase
MWSMIEKLQVVIEQQSQEGYKTRRVSSPHMSWLLVCSLLLCACLGASWFAYQTLLLPQPHTFTPNWRGAQWIQAADGQSSVASFRYVINMPAPADAAFITLAASQQHRIYINGTMIGNNAIDSMQGQAPQAAIYDILSELVPGPNVVAIRVSNLDGQQPLLRANVGLVYGQNTTYYGTDSRWQATIQAHKTDQRYSLTSPLWTSYEFDASAWQTSKLATTPSFSPQLAVNPGLYERPLPQHWMSAGASHDAYFVRKFETPHEAAQTWLRVLATGPTSIYLNGTQLIAWNGQRPIVQQQPADYLSDAEDESFDRDSAPRYRGGLALGIYDISPYLRNGTNVIAAHVSTSGTANALVGLETLNAAMTLEMLTGDGTGKQSWMSFDVASTDWHAARQYSTGWMDGNEEVLRQWGQPFAVGRPGISKTFYLPDSASPRDMHVARPDWIAQTLFLSSATLLALWWLMARGLARKLGSLRVALQVACVAYLPALGAELLLIVLGQERSLPQPFPYNGLCGLALLAMVGVSYGLLWLGVREKSHVHHAVQVGIVHCQTSKEHGQCEPPWTSGWMASPMHTVWSWLRVHWGFVLVMLVAVPMICYQITYEPYWQDELTSYYAAKGILEHGLPYMPSGFLYPKGELYSYLLALSIVLFGEHQGLLRLPSMLCYLLSLPIFYTIATRLFDRRVALLATAMLALSPFTLLWGRSVRMYELAQFMTLFVIYLFYRAAREPTRPHLIYLAALALLGAYLSHEETFILLPGLALCVFLLSYDQKRRLPAVLWQKHWWFAGALCAVIILMQLTVVHFSHPPQLGTDQSQQPFIQIGMGNVPYYLKLLFFPFALNKKLPIITLSSLLALLGCGWALYRGDWRAKYCTIFLLSALATLIFCFTMKADRYIYPLFPLYYMLGAYVLLCWLRALWQGVNRVTAGKLTRHRVLFVGSTLMLCASLLVLPALPLGGYNLFVSRISGLSYRHRYVDYDAAGTYIQQHWREGDVVISVAPAIITRYYAGHLDYFFSVDRALYLFEQDGKITDTPTGTRPLLSQGDLRAVLSRQGRIWVVTDKGLYQAGIQQGKRFSFPPGFHLVYNGYGAAVYLRDG